MYKLSIENNKGEVLDFPCELYQITKITGLTPPKVNISTSQSAFSDNEKVNSVKLSKRNLVFNITLQGDIENSRIELYRYFPPKQTVKVYYQNEHRNVYIYGIVEKVEADLFTQRQSVQVSLICTSPYFRAIDTLVTEFSSIDACFEFPFSIKNDGVEFSAISQDVRKVVPNSGDCATGMIIELFANGSVVNPVIYDVMKKTKLALNFSMQTSDKIIINTNVGEKSIKLIRDGVESNIMGALTRDSVWLQVENGENVYTFDCDSGNTALQMTFKTEQLYSGV